MAAVDRGMRGRLVKAGVIPAIVHVLRTTLSQDAAAGACGIVQVYIKPRHTGVKTSSCVCMHNLTAALDAEPAIFCLAEPCR